MARQSLLWILVLVVLTGREGRAEDTSHGWDGGVFLTVSGGYHTASRAFAYGDTQTVFQEEASAQARITQNGAPALDVGGGVRLFGPLGIGATLSTVHAKQITALTVTELRLGLFGGPSRFWIHQALADDAELEPTLNSDLSFVVAIPTVLYNTVNASAWGFHAGAELNLRVSRNVSIGGLARYSRGIAHVENALFAARTRNEGKTVEVELGGLSVTGGLKLWF